MPRRVAAFLPVPREVAFDYLVDPHNRPEWQLSLQHVRDVGPMPPAAGTSWRERALGGVVSEMTLTAVERPRLWAESGTFRGLSATLSLTFDEAPGGCIVVPRMQFFGEGPWRLPAAVISRIFPYAVRADLARAARILDSRGTGR